jgi:hypothetical protein
MGKKILFNGIKSTYVHVAENQVTHNTNYRRVMDKLTSRMCSEINTRKSFTVQENPVLRIFGNERI